DPFFSKNADLNQQIGSTKRKLQKYLWLLKQKDVLDKGFSGSPLSKSFFNTEQDNVIDALAVLEDLATESGIRIVDLRPNFSNRTKTSSAVSSIELRSEGTIEGVLKFVYLLENSASALKIKKMQISSKSNSSYLEARFTIAQINPAE
ncbi:MAG: hypothetical protein PHD09_00455, partial [Candidatus Omnitrophica bacterium]|nr:hypothetical protein [Candidatus Omnitrophota bacterium]